MRRKIFLAAAASLLGVGVLTAPALAQSNIDKMRGFQVTGTSLDIPTVTQDPAYVAQLRKNLESVKLPPGFKIDVFDSVADARHMAVSKSIGVVFTGTRKSLAWAVTDRDRDRIADEVKVLAPSIKMKVPNGMCITNDGILYVVEHNRILILPAIEFFYESPDNKLYVTLGQPFNVPSKAKRGKFKSIGLDGIIRMNRDGTGREIYVDGIRNSVGHAWNPANGELWFTDNQVDGMGDDIPPGELNRVTAKGQNFGFPVKYRGGIFSAQHGSWNRTTPVGARVLFTSLNEDGSANETVPFAEGWLVNETGEYLGRPVDVEQYIDGSILVSDDLAGAIYRISYDGS